MAQIARRTSTWILLMTCLGCGGAPSVKLNQTVTTSGVNQRALPKAGYFFTKGLPTYSGRIHLPRNPIEKTLIQSLHRTIKPPAGLDCLAREYAARFGKDGQDPSPSTVYEMAHHCGYWTKPVHQLSVTGSTTEQLLKYLQTLPDQVTQGMVGIGAVSHLDGKITATILVPPNSLSFEPIDKTSHHRITGRLERGDGPLEFWHQSHSSKKSHIADRRPHNYRCI